MKNIWKQIKLYFSLKSPCCNVPMGNKEYHDAFADMPIYECPKCNKKWI